VYMLATHPYGCRVIQRILKHCNAELTQPILNEIIQSCYGLVQDQYGNYVIQHVLEKGRKEDQQMMIQKLLPQLVPFSLHKFASNVVEKCVAFANSDQRREILREVLTLDETQQCTFQKMIKDAYANYVVQKLIDVANQRELQSMVSRIKSHVAEMKKYTYGKHILAKLEKLTGQHI